MAKTRRSKANTPIANVPKEPLQGEPWKSAFLTATVGLIVTALGVTVGTEENFPWGTENRVSEGKFTVHFNGDGLGNGIQVTINPSSSLDNIILTTCQTLIESYDSIDPTQCLPSNGARLFTHEGLRCFSWMDIEADGRTYIVPQGLNFMFPIGNVGDVIYPKSVQSPIPQKPIRLKQLTMSPRVFSVENFLTTEEMNELIEFNRDRVEPSQIGFTGRKDSSRTSSTAWDANSPTGSAIQKRAFDLVAIQLAEKQGDSVQVLRYENNEWYKPHVDFFDGVAYDNYDPTINNGTNRFVTVFLYLSDVEEGGETVFPLSTTHESYTGEKLVHPNTVEEAGYISDSDAKWVCNASSNALKSKPIAGNAVLFYSQGPDGTLDNYSLHGGCPVRKGTKWSANVWVWNRDKPPLSAAKDGKTAANSIGLHFLNDFEFDIRVHWDNGEGGMVLQNTLASGDTSRMTTYPGHRFVAKTFTGEVVGEYIGNVEDNGKIVRFSKL